MVQWHKDKKVVHTAVARTEKGGARPALHFAELGTSIFPLGVSVIPVFFNRPGWLTSSENEMGKKEVNRGGKSSREKEEGKVGGKRRRGKTAGKD